MRLNRILSQAFGEFFLKKDKSVALLFLATFSGQVLFFLLSPWLVSKYGADGFGVFAFSYSIIAVGGGLAALKIDSLIAITTDLKLSNELVAASIISVGIIGMIALILVVLGPNSLWLLDKSLCYIIICAAIVQALVNILIALATKNSHFNFLAANKFLNFGFLAVIALFLPKDYLGSGFVASVLICVCLQLLLLCFPLWPELRALSFGRFEKKTMNEIQSAVKHLFPASALDMFTQQLPVFIITTAFGPSILGMYSLASRFIYAPFASVIGSVSLVFTNQFSKNENGERKSILVKTWKRLVILSLPFYLIVFIFVPYAFTQFYGESWALAGEMARPLALLAFVNIIFSPTSVAFVIIGLRTIPVKLALTAVIYRIFSFWVGYYFNNIIIGLYLLALFEATQILIINKYLINKL
jgi:O-antigen/teichoic acid export membrane protein